MEIYERIKKDVVWICAIVLAIQFIWWAFPISRDDTDGDTRSGLVPRTDARTGCQYLESAGGGLTPRLDKAGKHICAA